MITSSKKVFPNDCDYDRQPEIATWSPKPEILISLEKLQNIFFVFFMATYVLT